MTDIAVQYSCDVFSMRKREVVDFDFRVFKSLVTLTALRMGDLHGLRQSNSAFGVARGARRLFATMAFKTGFFRRTEGGRIMRVVINVIVARGARVFQLLNVEPVRNGDVVRVDFGGGLFHIQDTLMTADAIWIDLVKLGGKTGMIPSALQRKDIDARHHGMTRRMALGAVNLRMHGRLLPE